MKLKTVTYTACGILGILLIGLAVKLSINTEHVEVKVDYKNKLPFSVEGLGGNLESYEEAMYRIMELDNPGSEDSTLEGLGVVSSIDTVIGRRKPDGFNDNGKGLQCSKYTGYLGTGQMEYSIVHPDYGPANGKDMTAWLKEHFGYKDIDTPVMGAIGSGGFNTRYGHTVMFLYSTGEHTAMVNDANFVPLTVSTHEMNIDDWEWVVPPDYDPYKPDDPVIPTPTQCDIREVKVGDTLGKYMFDELGYIDWSKMNEYAKTWRSTKFMLYQNVYDGWTSENGVGLFAGDTVERCQ